jgi:hypothetical protein
MCKNKNSLMSVWPAKLYSKFPVILERQLSGLNRTPYDSVFLHAE